MTRTKVLPFLSLLLLPCLSMAQLIGSSSKKKKADAEEPIKSTLNTVQYDQATALAVEANKQLLAGEVRLADSLIRLSIKTYPIKSVYEYASSLYRSSDAKTANEIMDLLFAQLDKQSTKNIIVQEQVASKYVDGKGVFSLIEKDIDRAKIIFGTLAFQVNQEFGDYKRKIQILETLALLNIQNTSTTFKPDLEYLQFENYKWILPLETKDYAKAILILNQIPKTQFFSDDIRNTYLAQVYFESGDYENAFKFAEKLKGYHTNTKYYFSFKIYALKGDNEKSMVNFEEYRKFLKKTYTNDIIPNEMYYYLSVIDLNKKNYQKALVNLDSTLNVRIVQYSNGALVDRWKIFKLMGDAYTGLEQYEKAKDNYNIALLTNPDFEPTREAIVKLETIIGTTISTDKTAPVISLLEPAPTRGLKVTTVSSNVLIKGIANDISGIKEVSINNKVVYAQKSGDFWGEIPLNEGMNKLTITATDLVGNKAVQVFEVERIVAKPVIANTNEVIIPVAEKIGKNFCLLIGAQNYSDINIPSLSNPIADAVKLKLILKSTYNFTDENIVQLFNPGLDDVKRQLLELTNQLQPEDNLLIFYAGHGIWVEKEKKGYWLMTDSKRNDVNTWLPNKTVLDLIAKIPSRHMLLITDACFSGSVFKTRGLKDGAPKAIMEIDEKISRIAITSGNDTEVPDESVFMKYLVKALSENKEKYLTAQKMFINQILEAVLTETKTEPRYGTLELAGHIGGDYIFIKK